MSSKKYKNTKKKFLRAEEERSRILAELLRESKILRGSYALIHTKCGKDNCWCREGNGHPHSRITWREKNQAFTRKVPPDQIAWVRKVTESYRNFRSLRRKLYTLEADSKKLLDEIQNYLIKRTGRGKSFLGLDPSNRKKKSRKVPKNKKCKKEAKR